ncbi:hypothetical protein PGT21_017198 [Puccinia graminis f. sp. tritici]|uniref:RRM domain-containing protein n=1 Tax=Puccinia graminis f. sp. tritici TaxID=56615 RepID=A0A5B0LM28_PUCGR|nr:hypothetical protein PGT21_017198 [Puccinia graminis f. sp. tritici]
MNSNRPENYSAEGQDAAQMSCKIYVGNLAWATDENALSSHFASVGEVKGAVVMRSEGRSRGFGFVTFANPEQAKQAIDTMYDSELRMMHECFHTPSRIALCQVEVSYKVLSSSSIFRNQTVAACG